MDSLPSTGFPWKLLEGSSEQSPSAVRVEQSCSTRAPSLHYFPGASQCPPCAGACRCQSLLPPPVPASEGALGMGGGGG